MFKSINNKITTCLLSALIASTFVGCNKDSVGSEDSLGEGALSLNITKADISGESSTTDDMTLRIYNSNDRLIARYSSEEIPEAIYLAAGDYKATVCVGEEVEISTDVQDISYYGEQEFTIEGGAVESLDIKCTVQNTVVAVTFDQTVYDRFELEAISYLSLANEFSLDDVLAGTVSALSFTEDGTGYFILPDGVDNIAWAFYGESADIDYTTATPSTTAEFFGVIENPAAATLYTLNFKYTATPDGTLELVVSIDESMEEFNDLFSFSPQPTISGNGFDISDETLVFTGADRVINITSISDISEVKITSEILPDGSLTIYDDGAVAEYEGISYVETSLQAGVLTLSADFLGSFESVGSKDIKIEVVDVVNSTGKETMSISVSGAYTPTIDLWLNSARFSADVYLDGASDVKFAYKLTSEEDWTEVAATKDGDYGYSVTVEPTWVQSKNDASLVVYNIEDGFFAGNTYEYKLIVDGAEFTTNSIATAAGHTITNGDMESSSIPSFTSSSSSSTNWASGNNTFSSDLCAQVSLGGSNCAYLKSRTAAGVFAAGNLAFGQFAMSGFSGTMSFGQALTWTSRPRSFKFRYAATIGAETHDDGNLLDGTDRARVYFAIVDWSGRHGVTAGTSGSPDGVWDPATQTSTDEGQIIGYASIFFDESTSTDGLFEVEIPINYYDNVTCPTKNISIVVSCAASAYGDYMTGSTNSRLWVDDFELVY